MTQGLHNALLHFKPGEEKDFESILLCNETCFPIDPVIGCIEIKTRNEKQLC